MNARLTSRSRAVYWKRYTRCCGTAFPIRNPIPQRYTDYEKAKLIRHHARRLRQLGADEKLIELLIQQMEEPAPAEQAQTRPAVIRRACPAKVCRGALGFPRSPNP